VWDATLTASWDPGLPAKALLKKSKRDREGKKFKKGFPRAAAW